MEKTRLEFLFSQTRLQGYQSTQEHFENLKLIQHISVKIGILEIISRNRIASILGIVDNHFISAQTLGYWCDSMKEHKIHNTLLDMRHIDFKKYSIFNKKDKMRNYQKVEVAYSLLRTLRNRAFHFENLLKQNANGTPRLSTRFMFAKVKL